MPGWSKLVGGWLLAVSIAVALSWGAVAKVRNQVIPTPIEVPSSQEVAAFVTVTTSATIGATVTQVIPEPGGQGVTSTTVGNSGSGGSSTTTTRPTEASSTSTPTQSLAPSTTSTTVLPVETQTSSYQLVGGVVNISYSPGSVNLVSAVPQSGYSTDQSDSGPEKVRVRFKSDSHTSEFRAEWKSGELTIARDESGGDD